MGRVFLGRVAMGKGVMWQSVDGASYHGERFMDEIGMWLYVPGTTCHGPFVGIQV
jgi:hypothetical protein